MTSRTAQPLSSPSPSASRNPDRLPAKKSEHAPLLDAAAAVVTTRLLDQRSAHGHGDVQLQSITENLTAERTEPAAATTIRTSVPSDQVQFRSQTIAPSPPASSRLLSEPAAPRSSASALSTHVAQPESLPQHRPSCPRASASGDSCHLRTDVQAATPPRPDARNTLGSPLAPPTSISFDSKAAAPASKSLSRTPSFKTSFGLAHAFPAGAAISTPSSTVPSPAITAMGDVTPLPSPLLSGGSPGPWKRLERPRSRDAPNASPSATGCSVLVTSAGESVAAAVANQPKRRAYAGLAQNDGIGYSDEKAAMVQTRHRSVSEYVPDPFQLPRRMVAVSGSHAKVAAAENGTAYEGCMRREPNLSEARGLASVQKPPTPPPSESCGSAASSTNGSSGTPHSTCEQFEAYGRHDRKRRRWRAVKLLGQGTFSRVLLATSQSPARTGEGDDDANGNETPPLALPAYARRTLVAVKICEHGPRGGASEERVEMSLKRELEIMQNIHHPCLVHLKAWSIEPSRAILVLSYCPGGDLFEFASANRHALRPSLLRRIFAELIGAVTYLHESRIVHRDIKLENVLVNLTPAELTSSDTDWFTYPYSVITLADLGLSRRITDDEKLETRCGSDDYAAPEVIMGQPYDGRATDAWSLGVLLYALLEGRLPFDPMPGAGDLAAQMRMRSRTSHRIARVEWRWVEYGVLEGVEGDGDHEADPAIFEAKGLGGAREVVENLLKRARSRWSIVKVAETEWVRGGICVEGGIKFREEEEGEEVS